MTLDEATSTMNVLVQQGSTAAHQIGTLYNHIVSRKLAELAGYKTSRAYFNKHVKGLSQATLSAYGTVARQFPESVCTQYGMFNLRALISYVEATGGAMGSDPGLLTIDVPQEDGKVVTKPFSDCSVEEVERATRAKKAPPPVRVPVPDQARLLFFEDSLFRNFNGVAQVRFSAHNEDGKTFLNLQNVPMQEVTRLIQALQEGLEAQPSLLAK
ncbi:hypothetical protein [Archangium sp.]|jgi:hypothetical protein|uniref:hypothetical protein n=1 Tax=Archangium sp. TaxID=1872627 RepID=UPI002ED9B032